MSKQNSHLMAIGLFKVWMVRSILVNLIFLKRLMRQVMKTIKKIIDKLAVPLLFIMLSAVLIGVVVLGWALLQEANIIVNIVGAIMFLTGSGFIIVAVITVIFALFTVLCKN